MLKVPIKEKMFDKEGKMIDSCLFKFEVNLDELEKFNNARLFLKPLDPYISIERYYFEANEGTLDPYDFEHVHKYECNFFYNDEDDKIILNVFNGFDVAIFNICSLLGIGHVAIDETVPCNELGFAPVHDRVSTLTFTLEEFKRLDGFVARFKFTPHFILFKGLLIGANYIHDNVKDDDRVPDFESDYLLRGEKLFLMD